MQSKKQRNQVMFVENLMISFAVGFMPVYIFLEFVSGSDAGWISPASYFIAFVAVWLYRSGREQEKEKSVVTLMDALGTPKEERAKYLHMDPNDALQLLKNELWVRKNK